MSISMGPKKVTDRTTFRHPNRPTLIYDLPPG